MTEKKTKLKEEELQQQQVAPEAATPAAPEEVAAAQPAAPAEPVAPATEPLVAEDASNEAGTFTAPEPGMIPVWIHAQDVASAVAMSTGDMEAASTAPDATLTDEQAPATPADVSAPAEPALTESLKLSEDKDEDHDEVDDAPDVADNKYEQDPAPIHSGSDSQKKIKEAEEGVEIEDIPEEDIPEEGEEASTVEDVEEPVVEEAVPAEEAPYTFEAEVAEKTPEAAADATIDIIQDATDYLDELLNDEDLVAEEEETEEDKELEMPAVDDEDLEDIELEDEEPLEEAKKEGKKTEICFGTALSKKKNALSSVNSKEELIDLVQKTCEPIANDPEQEAYLNNLLADLKKQGFAKGLTHVYDIILKGEGLGVIKESQDEEEKALPGELSDVLGIFASAADSLEAITKTLERVAGLVDSAVADGCELSEQEAAALEDIKAFIAPEDVEEDSESDECPECDDDEECPECDDDEECPECDDDEECPECDDEDFDLEDEDLDDEDLDDEDFENEDLDESLMHEEIEYPAGYGKFIDSDEDLESRENLVKAYEKTSAARRKAYSKFREALRTPSRISEAGSDNNSWSNNRFEEKYEERSQLDFAAMLKNGFLG